MHAIPETATTAIVAGAALDGPLAVETLRAAGLLVAVDSGADALLALGVLPHLAVGDMDSVSAPALEWMQREEVEVVMLARDKDETDLEVALQLAVARGARDVTVYAALGGPRFDHALATCLLLGAPFLSECRVRLVDRRHQVFLARGDVTLAGAPGDYVSLLPLSTIVEAVQTEGLRFALHREPLHQDAPRGVSNELLQPVARVRHGAGRLLVVHYRKEVGDVPEST